MVDTPEGTSDNELMQMLLKSTGVMIDAIESMAPKIADAVSSAISGGTTEGVEKAKSAIGEIGETVEKEADKGKKALVKLFNFDDFNLSKLLADKVSIDDRSMKEIGDAIDGIADEFRKTATSAVDVFSKTLGDSLGGVDLSEIAPGIFDAITGAADTEAGKRILAFGTAATVLDKTRDALKSYTDLEQKAVRMSADAASTFGSTWHAALDPIPDEMGNAAQATRTLSDITNTYAQNISDLTMTFGLSRDMSKNFGASVAAAGISLEQLVNIDAGTVYDQGEAIEKKFTGMEAMFLAAASSGLKFEEVAKHTGVAVNTLGVSAGEALSNIEMFGRVVAGSKMSISDVSSTIMDSASQFAMYGNNVQGAAGIYKGFLKTLGEGREALAAPLFKTMMNGINQMNDGLKAYLGMTSGIGTGGGGAIGGVLAVEEALATGTGLEDILQAVTENIEKQTGGPILTREEAIETGQQEKHYRQRQLMGMQLGVSDAGQQAEMMNLLAKGDFAGMKQAISPDAGGGRGFDLGRATQVGTAMAGGAAAAALNRADMMAETGLVDAGKSILAGGESLSTAAKEFKIVTDTISRILKGETTAKAEADKRAAKDAEDIFTGKKTDDIKAKSLEQAEAVSSVAGRTGAAPLEAQAEMTSHYMRTQTQNLEAAASTAANVNRTATVPLESLKSSEPPLPPAAHDVKVINKDSSRRLDVRQDGAVPPATIKAAEAKVAEVQARAQPATVIPPGAKEPIQKDVELSFKLNIDKGGMISIEPYVKSVVDARTAAPGE